MDTRDAALERLEHPDPEPGTSIHAATPVSLFAGRYRLLEPLGAGASGEVFAAFDEGPLQRRVALKRLRPRPARPGEAPDTYRTHFLSEVRLAGSLSHPNIATVHDADAWNGQLYLVQELIDGVDLQRFLQDHAPLDPAFALELARQLCDGLAYAHRHGVLHRDIKPGNLLIDADHRLRIVDFGLASSATLDADPADENPIGTPGYAAPEQLRDLTTDARADLFSAACVVYQLLTGRPAFIGRTLPERLRATLLTEPPPPSQLRPDLPRSLDRVLARALRKEPDDRYPDVESFAQALEHHAQLADLDDRTGRVAALVAAVAEGRCVLVAGPDLDVAGASPTPASASARPGTLPASALSGAGALPFSTSSRPAPSHALLARAVRLPWSLIVSSRVDAALSTALDQAGLRASLLTDPIDEPEAGVDRTLLQVCGRLDGPDDPPLPFDEALARLDRLPELSDGARSSLATSALLFLGYAPGDPLFRQLYAHLTRLRPGGGRDCFLAAAAFSLADVRWARSKGLKLIEVGGLELIDELAGSLPTGPTTAPAHAALPGRPYKFLDHYGAGDEAIFFGRAAETQRLYHRILARPVTVLYGASGAGKTSLVCAGLMPRLERAGFHAVYARVFDDPWAEIVRAVAGSTAPPPAGDAARLVADGASSPPAGEVARPAADGAAPPPAGDAAHPVTDRAVPPAIEDLPAWLAEQSAPHRLLIIVLDQLEELFGRFGREVRQAFAEVMRQCLDACQGRLRLVFSLRADHLARLAELSGTLPGLLEHGFFLEPLTDAQAREALLSPARLMRIDVEPALVDRLIVDLSRDGIDPPQLQLVCDALYEARDRADDRLTLRAYLALGEVDTILTRHLERVLDGLDPIGGDPVGRVPVGRDHARAILKAMVTAEDLRSVSRPAQIAQHAGLPLETALRALELLAAQRIVRSVQRQDGDWFELAHECLAREIGRWLSDDERQLQTVRALLEQGMRSHRHLGILLSPAQLRLISAQRRRLVLTAAELDFLDACQRAVDRSRRRWSLGLAAALLLALAGTLLGRGLWLSDARFARATDRPLTWMHWDKVRSGSLSTLEVMRGAPDPWPIDGLLGFPQLQYQTDFNLDQVEATRRDALRAGMALEPDVPLEDQLLGMLSPVDRVRHLAVTGRTTEALELIATLRAGTQVNARQLLSLMPVFALSPVLPPGIEGLALELAARQAEIEAVNGAAFPRRGEVGEPLALLFYRLPRQDWAPRLQALAGDSLRIRLAVDVLDAIGTLADGALVTRALSDDSPQTAMAAFAAIRHMGACEALPVVRERLDVPGLAMLDLRSVIPFLGDCGDASDLPRLDRLAPTVAQMPEEAWDNSLVASLVSAVHRLSPGHGVSLLARILEQHPPAQRLDPMLGGLGSIPDPAMAAVLRRYAENAPPGQASIELDLTLATHGDAGRMKRVWETAQARLQDPGIMPMLMALSLFHGPALQDMLLERLRRERPPTHVYLPALEALQRAPDAAARKVLIDALGDRDIVIVHAAQDILPLLPRRDIEPLLEARLADGPVLARVGAAKVLQHVQGTPRAAFFREILASPPGKEAQYAVRVEAVEGLSDALGLEPVAASIEALRSPDRHVRLAATLSLARRTDPSVAASLETAASSADRWTALALARARWAWSAARQVDEMGAGIDQALSEGHPRRALQLLDAIRSPAGGYRATIEAVLSPDLPGPIDDPDWEVLRVVEALFATGQRRPLNWLQAYVPRAYRAGLRSNPRLEPLNGFYAFRVLAGLEPPKTVDLASSP